MVELKILSHACMLFKTEKYSIIIDPWLVGSCYWRSWWNYPVAEVDPDELASVDAVIISHIHWDHWHGPTLKKYFRGKKIIIPDEPGLRSEEDFRTIGFKDIVRIPHGKSIEIGDIKVTLYQFGLHLNDSAIVVEAEGVKVLDANDAKIAGWSLQQLLSRHGKFDFALRSHSSANARICFRVRRETIHDVDDREHYFRSYMAFMDAVNPHFAIPFASNHCHLHDDVYSLNNYVSNPIELDKYISTHQSKKQGGWTFKPMLPGSTWNNHSGFHLADTNCFENFDQRIAQYRDSIKDRLDDYTTQENAVKIKDSLLARFVSMLPRARRGTLLNRFAVTLHWPDGRAQSWIFDLTNPTPQISEPLRDSQPNCPVMFFPAIIFRDAIAKNMFHHAVISKRCNFLADSAADMQLLDWVMTQLDRYELGVRPTSWKYRWRLITAYIRRWRELFVYAHALWLLKIKRKPIYLAEEAILRGEY